MAKQPSRHVLLFIEGASRKLAHLVERTLLQLFNFLRLMPVLGLSPRQKLLLLIHL